ncbi:hypothetical protein [Parabacteroides distasonis]|nr:hypothetical protein [Parabacteroides distasonis]
MDVALREVEKSTRDCGRQEVEDAANMQMTFILLHETYHILLSQLPGLKK